jgi:type II secretory pathway pseudopilin PulG
MSLVVGTNCGTDPIGLCAAARRKRGISLIEVLGAVAILWLCFGFVLPLITSSRRSAVRQLAVTETVSIAQALLEYRNVYGRWPGQTQAVADVVYGIVGGESVAPIWEALLENPRKLTFLDVDEGSLVEGELLDPWDRPYLLAMDENGDGLVNLVIDGVLATSVSTRAVAMAYGPETTAVRIRSWDASGTPE